MSSTVGWPLRNLGWGWASGWFRAEGVAAAWSCLRRRPLGTGEGAETGAALRLDPVG